MRILVVEDEKLLCDGIAEDLELEKNIVLIDLAVPRRRRGL